MTGWGSLLMTEIDQLPVAIEGIQATPKLNDLKEQSPTIAYESVGQLDIPADSGLARLILPGFIYDLQTADNHLGAAYRLVSLGWLLSALCLLSSSRMSLLT